MTILENSEDYFKCKVPLYEVIGTLEMGLNSILDCVCQAIMMEIQPRVVRDDKHIYIRANLIHEEEVIVIEFMSEQRMQDSVKKLENELFVYKGSLEEIKEALNAKKCDEAKVYSYNNSYFVLMPYDIFYIEFLEPTSILPEYLYEYGELFIKGNTYEILNEYF